METSTSTDPDTIIANLLSNLTTRWVSCINNRKWSDPFWVEYVAPDLEVSFEHLDNIYYTDRNHYLEAFDSFTRGNAEYHCDIINMSVEVLDKEGLATVWLFVRIMGDPQGTQKETAIVTYWRRSGGRWAAYRQMGIRSGCFL